MNDTHASASRYWNTLRYLRPIQIADRVWRAVHRPSPKVASSFGLRRKLANWIEPPRPASTMCGADEFEFLGKRRRVQAPRDWNEKSWPLLWRFHLHYFDDLNALDFEARSAWHRALMGRWMAENPPTTGVGWQPYPTSLRVMNWIKWWLAGAVPTRDTLHSVRLQIAHVMSRLEYHLLGNHLLENARALVFGGLFFEGPEADRWLHRGVTILAEQLPVQILADGGHCERSPMYHQIVLAGLLDLYNLMRVFARQECLDLTPPIQRMLRWSSLMSHPDGEIALFNDAAFHEAPTFQVLERYAACLGILRTAVVQAQIVEIDDGAGAHLTTTGYVRVARDGLAAILNVGSVGPAYQPGHAHADTLSFELSAMGRRLIVDTGTSTYERGRRRDWERSSAAHNTVVIDGLNSSDVWAGFRVARRARVLAVTARADAAGITVAAAHDGYSHLPARAVHERRWHFNAERMCVEDRIDGRGQVTLELIFNIHPDFEVTHASASGFIARSLDGTIGVIIDLPMNLAAKIAEFSYAPQFGLVRAGSRIVANARLQLPGLLVTTVRLLHPTHS